MSDTTFLTDGWARLPQFIAASEIDALTAAADHVLAQDRPPCMQRPGNDLVPLRWDDMIVATLLDDDRRMTRLTAAISARDLKWISAYVSTKAAHSPALWWHQDWWCWDHAVSYRRPASQVALLCYLGSTDRTNGALRLLPGTHHASLPLHALLPEAHGDDANALAQTHQAMSDYPGQVTLDMAAGDAAVIDYRLLHGTHPNAKPSRRDCILLSFAPDWSALPDDIQAHLAMHPALPVHDEQARREAAAYRSLLPAFEGEPASLTVNRNAPAAFAVT